ncbi:hypothetical protein [Dactylosporangium sp. NPDC051541]|uniref:hypothetical protein n=1 Tax=Dactylosporangium sp. NPDC051541 TaxID=3363977 RepID=UPI0037981441
MSTAYILLQGLFGAALSEFDLDFKSYMKFRLKQLDKQIIPPREAVVRMSEYGEAFAASYEFSPILVSIRSLINRLVVSPDEVGAVATQWLHVSGYRGNHLHFGTHGMDFTIAHEMAHHLLNHTRNGNKDLAAPGPLILQGRLDGIGYQLPSGRNSSHQQEFAADALAVLMLMGDESLPARVRSDWAECAAIGAFCALPALHFKEGIEAANRHGATACHKDTHPSLTDRAKNLLEIFLRTEPDHPAGGYLDPGLGRYVPQRPSGRALRYWACQAAMPLLSLSPLWTPRLKLEAMGQFISMPDRLSVPRR